VVENVGTEEARASSYWIFGDDSLAADLSKMSSIIADTRNVSRYGMGGGASGDAGIEEPRRWRRPVK
jgi:hypothetical protein